MHHPTEKIAHTTAFFYTSRGALAGTRNSSMGPPHEGATSRSCCEWLPEDITRKSAPEEGHSEFIVSSLLW